MTKVTKEMMFSGTMSAVVTLLLIGTMCGVIKHLHDRYGTTRAYYVKVVCQ